jgi:diguanylate cyclase (GGDEF)-like protein/PAS domain S-box-containing protein
MDSVCRNILNNLNEGVCLVDVNKHIAFWNRGAERITGLKADDVVGKHCTDEMFYHYKRDNGSLRAAAFPLHKTLLDGKIRESSVYLRHRSGQHVEVCVKTTALYDDNAISGAMEVFSETTEKQNPHPSEDATLYDALTGLPNRRYTEYYLKNRLNELDTLDISFSIILARIWNILDVQKAFGLDAGDKIIKLVAKEMRGAFRKNDFVGRWGGDELLVAIIGVSEEDLGFICEKVRNLIKNPMLRMEGESVSAALSISTAAAYKGDTMNSIEERLTMAERSVEIPAIL